MATAYDSANSTIPGPDALGKVYQAYFWPEYELGSRPAEPWLGGLGMRWAATARTWLWINAAAQTVSPTKPGPTGYGLEGSRRAFTATAGVTLRGP